MQSGMSSPWQARLSIEAIRSSAIVSAFHVSRIETLLAMFEMTHSPHHQPTTSATGWACQWCGFRLACQISFIAWYGRTRFMIGMKYQPTDQPGVNFMSAAPKPRTLRLAR